MREEVRASLRRLVRERARGRCEYCWMPDDEPLFPHEPDHIIALKHGGLTTSENLAYACFQCNRAKGSDIASIDPETDTLAQLYNPRIQIWHEHFQFNGAIIEPLTSIGRVTAKLLQLNNPARVSIRENLLAANRLAQFNNDALN
ncbi:MAG TPA: HNH endonuclease [Ktedonobacter sp.]|nr:HNH endonuclease [Ktedonobacter sp.]